MILTIFRQTTLEEKKLLVKELVSKAKVFASEGELYESIKYFKKAYKVLPSEKIKSRISRLKVFTIIQNNIYF